MSGPVVHRWKNSPGSLTLPIPFTRGFRLLTSGHYRWSHRPSGFLLVPHLPAGKTSYLPPAGRPGRIGPGLTGYAGGSLEKAPDRALALLREAVAVLPGAHTVCFDSWFATPTFLRNLAELGLDAVCRVKKTSRVFYDLQGKPVTLVTLSVRHQERYRGQQFFSTVVSLSPQAGIPVRILCVRSQKQPGEWVALLSTEPSFGITETIHRTARDPGSPQAGISCTTGMWLFYSSTLLPFYFFYGSKSAP